MKRLDRNCKVCGHPKRNHRLYPNTVGKCHNCMGWVMLHNFILDNLKYLEEKSERTLNNKSSL
jgi:hypothetical protein